MMRSVFIAGLLILGLTGCNSIYLKPNTLDTDQVIYADRGGYTMRRAIKRTMEQRGYNIVVGKAKSDKDIDSESIEIDTIEVPSDAKYIVEVRERTERFAPIWCALNGFWWWRFNVSIADQETNEELLTWFGYGCSNSSIRKLDKILDQLEVKDAGQDNK